MLRKRTARIEHEHGVAMTDYTFGAVLVDPPRAGLDATTLSLVTGFDHIIYISCNPTVALAEQAKVRAGHRVDLMLRTE